MKSLFFILIFLIFTFCFCSTAKAEGKEDQKLYPAKNGQLWGYIDAKGKMVIKPQFYAAKAFSEGLAAVRVNGRYGFINDKGKVVIQPKYEMADPFEYGLAKVYLNEKPYFIDKKGNIAFEHNFKDIYNFGRRTFTVALTNGERYCILNRQGKFITDTSFKRISLFFNGIASVNGLNHNLYPIDETQKRVYETGIIDTNGNFIIEYGKYRDLHAIRDSFILAELMVENKSGVYDFQAVLDNKGNHKFTVPDAEWSFGGLEPAFHQNLAVINGYSIIYQPNGQYSYSDKYYGAVDTSGKIVFADKNWMNITPFANNRAFVQDKDHKWLLIDKKGKRVSDLDFEKVHYDMYKGPEYIFENGLAYVKTKEGWGAIDTTGNFVTAAGNFLKVGDYGRVIRSGDILFYEQYIGVKGSPSLLRYGFWNPKENIIVAPQFVDIKFNGYNELIQVIADDNKAAYVDRKGKLVWKQKDFPEEGIALNADYMIWNYFYASSKYKKDFSSKNDWLNSDNRSKAASAGVKTPDDEIQLIIDPKSKTKWGELHKGLKLFVANPTKDTVFIPTQDAHLFINFQAIDKNGEWKDIMLPANNTCGHGYYSKFLVPNAYWEFAIPVFQGELKTKIRAHLVYRKSRLNKETDVLYSNEIEASVNPAQFWYKKHDQPRLLLGPLLE